MILPPICLSFACTESSGGSNGLADIKTYTARGLYGALVTTGILTSSLAPDPASHALPEAVISAQIKALPTWLVPAAIKVGLCPSVEVVHIVARYLRENPGIPVVCDPVLVNHLGLPVVRPEVITAVQEHLLPLASIITPNRHEAALMTGMEECLALEDLEFAAKYLFEQYGCPALVTGGSLLDNNTDVFYGVDGLSHFSGDDKQRGHIIGTGSCLSAAITVELARKESIRESIAVARGYVGSLVEEAPANTDLPGTPFGPLLHCLSASPREETSSWVNDLPES